MSVSDGDILKIIFEVALNDGTIAQNVYYLLAELAAPQADLSVTNAIETWLETAYGELTAELLSSMTQNLCTVQKIIWDAGNELWVVDALVGYFTPTITFNNSTDGLPNQSSAFASFTTYHPGHYGRKFMPPFGEDQQDGTYLESTALADMADYADDILDGIYLGPLNNLYAGIVRAAAGDFYKFAGAVVTNVLGSQRRRRPGVGI